MTLSDDFARRRIAEDLDATLFVEAGAGSGKTRSLVDRVVALVRSGVAMREIAAITFTEKAASELRDRIRGAFEQALAADPDGPFRAAQEQLDAAAISTLHAFAQRILSEHPIEARLPPHIEVLDEVASQIEFEERWRQFRDRLLDDPALERTLLLALATDVTLDDLRHLARVLGDNWDLVAEKQRLPWDRTEPPASDASDVVDRIDRLLGRLGECRNPADKLGEHLTEQIAPYLEQLRAAPDEYEVLRLLRQEQPRFIYKRKGSKANWADHPSVLAEMAGIGQRKDELARVVAVHTLQRIALEVADFTLVAAQQRRVSGRLEFHDLLVLARELLRDEAHGVDVRRALRRRYQRLLLDEFQDTDPIQVDLAVLIASDDPGAWDLPWSDVPVEPGRLFFVGDPKQSIYRFRRADIEVFLRARDTFGDPTISLNTNFRTAPPVIDWINHVFGRLIVHEPGSQPAYEPLTASPLREPPPVGPAVTLLGRLHTDEPDAETLREREAGDVAGAVVTALGWTVADRDGGGRDVWRPARLGDITILLPARTSLPALERALQDRGISYRAETSSLVYSTREVRDLLAATRALADPTDQLSLVTALRSAIFGCGDDDLVTYRLEHRGAWSFRAPLPSDLPADHPVAEALTYLRDLHAQLPWLAPSEVLDRIVRDRRLFELGYARGRPRDLWRRLRFVIDQARAWSAAEGGTLRQYVEWARMQASESARVAETILPETDDDSVRIMTIHAAKGLEFPITILSGMTTMSRATRARVQVVFPPGEPLGLRVGASLFTPEFEQFVPIDEQMDHHERLRLLYVACTRAKDHLVVSLHRKARRSEPDEERKYTNAELIARACVDAPHQQAFDELPFAGLSAVDAAPEPEPLLPMAEWEAERSRALDTSGRPRTVAASDVSGLLAPDLEGEGERQRAGGRGSEGEGERQRAGGRGSLDDEVAAGIAKGPRDLDLPPWQRGRYGTAIGRAVHAVLQTVDLATGHGLVETAAAQAAAEGVIGRDDAIVALARAALQAPSVRESLRWRRWRETFVATTIGDRTLEGYIDLLYRTDAGLVVVDFKTASSAADIAARVDFFRMQGGAYAVAVEAATGEPVVRMVFVFLTPQGAVERDLDDLDACRDAVRTALVQS